MASVAPIYGPSIATAAASCVAGAKGLGGGWPEGTAMKQLQLQITTTETI